MIRSCLTQLCRLFFIHPGKKNGKRLSEKLRRDTVKQMVLMIIIQSFHVIFNPKFVYPKRRPKRV